MPTTQCYKKSESLLTINQFLNQPCNLDYGCRPTDSLAKSFKNLSNPEVLRRYLLYKIKSSYSVVCGQNYTIKSYWGIVNVTNIPETVIFEDNPTIQSSEVVLTGGTLEYGLYKLTHNTEVLVTVNGRPDIPSHFIGTDYSYLRVIPSGITVFGLQNGIDYTLIGRNQGLELNAPLYSFDMDDLIKTSSLKFEYFCSIKRLNGSIMNKTGLLTLKKQGKIEPDSCFSSTGK